jgi:predicted rRNA methylase YqxC with S4 and FtsJ domains
MENPECANCILDCSVCELNFKSHILFLEEIRELTKQSKINLQLKKEKEIKEQIERDRVLSQDLIKDICSDIRNIARKSCITNYTFDRTDYRDLRYEVEELIKEYFIKEGFNIIDAYTYGFCINWDE